MNRKKRFINLCLALIMVICGGFLFINSDVKTVQAASSMVTLKENVNYRGYFTRDGKKSLFRLKRDSEYGYARIYLNGRYIQRIFIGKGANIYWCGINKKEVYLFSENHLYGGHELKVYTYSGGRFVSVKGESNLNKVLMFPEFTKISGTTLYVTSTPGSRNPSVFRNATTPLKVQTKYTLKNNKITCQSWNCKAIGNRTFYAMTSFRTSKSYKNMGVKNGPSVRAGQKVTLNYIRLGGSSYRYHITVNGKSGWVDGSEGASFR